MEYSLQKELFALLEEEFCGISLNTALVPGAGAPQIGDTLRVLLGITENAIPALVELMLVRLRDGALVLQFYTTLTESMEAEQQKRLETALGPLNFYCPLGSFGLYTGGQLYQKFAVVLEEEQEAPQLLETVLSSLAALQTVLDDYGGMALAIAGGTLTLQQAQEAGLLPAL